MRISAFLTLAAALASLLIDSFTEATVQNDSQKHVLLFAGLGSPSHIKPLILYAQALKERGHRISFVIGNDFEQILDKSEFDKTYLILDDGVMSPKSIASRRGNVRQVPYTIETMIRPIREFINRHDIALYSNFTKLIETLKSEGDAPNVIICDFFAFPCMDVSRAFEIPAVVSAHVPSVMGLSCILWNITIAYLFHSVVGNVLNPSRSSYTDFVPSDFQEMPLSTRLGLLARNALSFLPQFVSTNWELGQKRKSAGLPQPTTDMMHYTETNVVLVNSFHPLAVSEFPKSKGLP
jgi:hypothetical protein